MDTKDSPLADVPAEFWTELEQAKVRERSRGPREMQDTQDQFPQHPIQSAHPWARFLEARRDVIEWMLGDGHDAAHIARALSMDPGQVRLIHLSTTERAADRTIRQKQHNAALVAAS